MKEEIKKAISLLRNCSLRDLVASLEFYNENTPEEEWDNVRYDDVINYNSLVFSIMGERALEKGTLVSEAGICEEDGVKVIYDFVDGSIHATIDGENVYLNGYIGPVEEEEYKDSDFN